MKRAVAEEVRASIYSVRTGGPAYPEVLSRANSITRLLHNRLVLRVLSLQLYVQQFEL